MEFESFEQGVIEIKLEKNKEEIKNEANARKVGKCKWYNFGGKVFRQFAQLRCNGSRKLLVVQVSIKSFISRYDLRCLNVKVVVKCLF